MSTVLVVDDFASVRLYHTAFLKQKGYLCLEASNGSEALEILYRHKVDLVLLDLLMPNLSGAEFVRRVRSNPGTAALAIIAITSESMREESQNLKKQYGISLLQKPVLPDALLSEVRRVFTLKTAEQVSSR